MKVSIVRLAYDSKAIKAPLKRAIDLLKEVGIEGRRIVMYCLYGFLDTPHDFLERVSNLMEWGVVAYPMRYQPLEPGSKNSYVSPNWKPEQLEMVAKARRVIGYGGHFHHTKLCNQREKLVRARAWFLTVVVDRVSSVMAYTDARPTFLNSADW